MSRKAVGVCIHCDGVIWDDQLLYHEEPPEVPYELKDDPVTIAAYKAYEYLAHVECEAWDEHDLRELFPANDDPGNDDKPGWLK